MAGTTINTIPLDASLQKLASSFCCGNDYLDHFLKSHNALDDGFGKTYIALSRNGDHIVGYYNIGVGCIEYASVRGRVRAGGSIHINCFALAEKYQRIAQATTPDGAKYYLSDALLDDCIKRAWRLRQTEIGFSFITLASTKRGEHFYRRNDFDLLDTDLAFSVGETDKDCVLTYLPLDYE